jgi:PhoH-like ATPase
MRTTYVLDTSALVQDPEAYKRFSHSDVIIPITVLEELDKLKKQSDGAGKNARVASRLLDEICNLGDISTGILLENDILLKIDVTYRDLTLPSFVGLGDPSYGDTKILACLIATWKEHSEHDVCLVSNDNNLRVKSKAYGIDAQSHDDARLSLSGLYPGVKVITDEEVGYDLQQFGFIDPRVLDTELNPHECVLFQNEQSDGIAMGRKVAPNKIKLLKKHFPWGISGRNKEQIFAIDLIMDRSVDLVTLIGRAGSGKSLVALASALEMVLHRKEYERLVIYRPIQAVGNDIGFLPGEMHEKLAPWFQAIMDNFEVLFSSKSSSKGSGNDWKRDLEIFQKKGQIEMEAITYIRGRSIPNSIILIDECQNLTKDEVKTILTRAGEGTKIVMTGDIEQIDNSSLDATNNGLTYVIEKFKDSDLSGHVTFIQGERSKLATKAAEIL